MTDIGWEHAQGWRPFGYHVDFPIPAGWRLEFIDEDEDGMPVWERLERVEESEPTGHGVDWVDD